MAGTSVTFRHTEAEKWAEDQVVEAMERAGERVFPSLQNATPVRTGFAKRSLFWCVVANGTVVAGMTRDGNGQGVPPFKTVRGPVLIFGANAPYYIWIEIGARGRAGLNILGGGRQEAARIVLTLLNRKVNG